MKNYLLVKEGHKCRRILLLVLLAGAFIQGHAQKIPLPDSLNIYGKICTQMAFYNDILEIQNNASKIGLYLDYAFNNKIKILGHSEWAVNIVENNYSFNASTSTDATVPDAFFDESTSAFDTRLGYLGIDFNKFGIVTFGKQWSAYYDVSGWTDMFNVFGGEASSTYFSGTDGGETGGGRAAQVLIYRNNFGPVKVSLQTQLNGVRTNYCASMCLKISKELEVGAAINDIRISKETEGYILDAPDYELTGIFGVKFKNKKWYAAFNLNLNGVEVLPLQHPDTSVMYGYNFSGYELYAKYNIKTRFDVHGGFNIQIPTTKNKIVDDRFHLEYYVLGAQFDISPAIHSYFEFKMDSSLNMSGDTGFNVYTIGLNIDLSKAFGSN